jgi:hypothetical protein
MFFDAETLAGLARGSVVWSRWGRPVPCRLTPTNRRRFEEAQRQGFVLATGDDDPAVNCYVFWCRIEQAPCIVVRAGRWGHAEVDLNHVPWRLDLEDDVRVRAVLGKSLPIPCDGRSVPRLSDYCAEIDGERAEEIGAALVEIVRDSEPWRVPCDPSWEPGEPPWKDEPVPCRRPPDLPALAAYWVACIRDEWVRESIRRGYYLSRDFRDRGETLYRGYCELVGRPRLTGRILRGRAEFEIQPCWRVPRPIDAATVAAMRTLIGATGRGRDPAVFADPQGHRVQVILIPAARAEEVMARLVALLTPPGGSPSCVRPAHSSPPRRARRRRLGSRLHGASSRDSRGA